MISLPPQRLLILARRFNAGKCTVDPYSRGATVDQLSALLRPLRSLFLRIPLNRRCGDWRIEVSPFPALMVFEN